EVRGVRRHIGLRLEAVPCAAALIVGAGAEELHAVGDDLDRLALRAILSLPFTPVQAALDRDRATFGEVVRAVLALRAPDRYVEVVGLVDPVAALILAATVDGDAQLADGGPAGRRAQLRVPGQVPGDDDDVHVRGGHRSAPIHSIPNFDLKE